MNKYYVAAKKDGKDHTYAVYAQDMESVFDHFKQDEYVNVGVTTERHGESPDFYNCKWSGYDWGNHFYSTYNHSTLFFREEHGWNGRIHLFSPKDLVSEIINFEAEISALKSQIRIQEDIKKSAMSALNDWMLEKIGDEKTVAIKIGAKMAFVWVSVDGDVKIEVSDIYE